METQFSDAVPPSNTLVDLLRLRSLQQPEQEAYIFLVDGEAEATRLTYGELHQRACATAVFLQESGLTRERALLLYPPGLDYIIAFFSCLYANIVAIPAYPPNSAKLHKSFAQRIVSIIHDAKPGIILTTTRLRPVVETLTQSLTELQQVRCLTTDNLNENLAKYWIEPSIDGNTLAFLQYTSGSTATPKGVMISHENLLANLKLIQSCFEHTAESRGVIWLPPYHDMGLIGGILQPLFAGFPVILMSPFAFLQRPLRWLQAISRYKATASGGPNFAYELCTRRIKQEPELCLDLSSWKVAFNGAEPIHHETLANFSEAFAPYGFRKEAFYPCYGLAEATLIVSGGRVQAVPVVRSFRKDELAMNKALEEPSHPIEANYRKLVGCGQQLPGQQFLIVDPQTLSRCVPGETGEVWVSGPSVAQGYWQRPEETRAIFHAFLADESIGPFLRTGDLGFIDRDELFITARLKDLIIIRGRNYYPQDIELTVQQSHPALAFGRGAAFSLQSDSTESLSIVQELERGYHTFDLNEVIDTIRQVVGEQYQLQIHTVVLIKPGKIPLTSSGKVQRHACKEAFLAGKLDSIREATFTLSKEQLRESLALTRETLLALNEVERRSALEQDLLTRVSFLLKIPAISSRKPLSALGLDSLTAVELQDEVERNYGVQLPMQEILQCQGIAQLAQDILVRFVESSSSPPSLPERFVSSEEVFPLSLDQERLWYLDQANPGTIAYTIPMAYTISGKLFIPQLEQSINAVVIRHEALRTVFTQVNGVPAQIILPQLFLPMTLVDIRNISKTRQAEEVRQIFLREVQKPFNLATGPLIRAMLIRLDEQESVLLLSVHHIVCDLSSLMQLFEEIVTLYGQISSGSEPLPASLPLQFTDVVRWQRENMQVDRSAKQFYYWNEQLQGASFLELPMDNLDISAQNQMAAAHSFLLPEGLPGALHEFCCQEEVTPFMALLAAFNILLHHYTQTTDLLVGCPVSGRTHSNMRRLIGFLAHPLLLRTDLSNTVTYREVLRATKKVALDAFANQDLPLTEVLEIMHRQHAIEPSTSLSVFFSFLDRVHSIYSTNDITLNLLDIGCYPTDTDLFLTLFNMQGQIRGVFSYNGHLFHKDTIAHLADAYCAIVQSVLLSPDTAIAQFRLHGALEGKVSVREQKHSSPKTIALAGTFTIEPIEQSLSFWLQYLAMPFRATFAPYNQIFQQLLDKNSLLSKNQNGINVMLIRLEDWQRHSSDTEVEAFLLSADHEEIKRRVEEFIDALQAAARIATTPYLVFLGPPSPVFCSDEHAGFFQQMEELIVAELAPVPGVHLVTASELLTMYPVAAYYDAHTDKLGHIPFTPYLYTALGTMLARKIQALCATPYKVVVLDCDWTLWSGNCAEGEPIEVNQDHKALHNFLIALQGAGMLLCLCSKNNEEDVLAIFEHHPDMLLQMKHIAAHRINWKTKSENIKSLAEELNINLDSFIFLDDNPAECLEVQRNCSEVLTLQFPGTPGAIPLFLKHVWAFDKISVTEEDKKRTELYRQNRERERLLKELPNLEDFLARLELKVKIAPMMAHQLPRVAQLIVRTNQFNISTIRRSESEIWQLCQDQLLECLTVEVSDRFGEYGLVGVMLFQTSFDVLQVDTFLLSCRVLGRGVEHRMLAALGTIAAERGLTHVVLDLIPSGRNQPAQDFLTSLHPTMEPDSNGHYHFSFSCEEARTLTYRPVADVEKYSQTERDRDAQEARNISMESDSKYIRKLDTTIVSSIAEELFDITHIHNTIASHITHSSDLRIDKVERPRNDTEEKLALIWSQLLNLNQVGRDDNFFELGGDSIVGMMMIAKARQEGIYLTPRQLLETQTLAELAEVAGNSSDAFAEQNIVSGQVPLTPIQRWFFEQVDREPHHWNMALLFGVDPAIDSSFLQLALHHVLMHHDALRLSFVWEHGTWKQINKRFYAVPPFSEIDLSHLPEEEQNAAMQEKIAAIQASFDLAMPSLLHVLLCRLGKHKESQLLIVAHHLIIDGVSWRILLEDLQKAYEQSSRGVAIVLPPKTTSFKYWAERLLEFSQSLALQEEQEYWLTTLLQAPVSPIPVDHRSGKNDEGSVQDITLELTVEETNQLLHEMPGIYHTRIDELLLTALLIAFNRWTGSPSLFIDIEGHGREDIFDDIDTSRTIGWFTSIFPLYLNLGGKSSLVDILKRVKEHIRAVPHRGRGYGVLRYSNEDSAFAQRLRNFPQPAVSFNYLGQFDPVFSGALFSFIKEASSTARSMQAPRRYLIEIIGSVRDNRLQFCLRYSKHFHRADTIQVVAQEIVSTLQQLLQHSQTLEAEVYTPTDFPAADLDQEELDAILAELSDTVGDAE